MNPFGQLQKVMRTVICVRSDVALTAYDLSIIKPEIPQKYCKGNEYLLVRSQHTHSDTLYIGMDNLSESAAWGS